MAAPYDILLPGFPGSSPRGFLGWSTVLLLRGPDGPVLFDTGDTGDRPGLFAALETRGLGAGDIGTVILSHLHFDHCANVECFPGARVLLHETEAAYLKGDGATDIAIAQATAHDVLGRAELIAGEPELWPGLRMIRTPGHSGGHASLVVEDAGSVIVLAQDAVKHRGDLAEGRANGAVDLAAGDASLRRIADMADVIVPGHDAPLEKSGDGWEPLARVKGEITFALTGRRFGVEI